MVPRKFQYMDSPEYIAISTEEHYRPEYYKLIDKAQSNLKDYFTLTDLDKYGKLTEALLTDNVYLETICKYP